MGAVEHGRPTTPYHRGGTETAQETNLVSNGKGCRFTIERERPAIMSLL